MIIGHMLEIILKIHLIYSHMSRINIFFKFPLLSNVKLIESHAKNKVINSFYLWLH
jgi:hypothetical protein